MGDAVGVVVGRPGHDDGGGVERDQPAAIDDRLVLVGVAQTRGAGETTGQVHGGLAEHGPGTRIDVGIELIGDAETAQPDPRRLAVRFVEDEQAANPRDPRPVVRHGQLLGPLTLDVVHVGDGQVQLGDVPIDHQLVVERAIRGEAGQGGGRGDLGGEAHRPAVLNPLAGRRHRGVDLVQVGRVVHLEPRLHRQHLRVAHRRRILVGGVGREQELAAPVQDHPQPAERRGHVFPAQRILRMVEIAYEPVADAAQDGRAAHHPAAHQGTADPGGGSDLTGAARQQPNRRLGLVGRYPRHDVHRAADDVAPVEGALRSAQHLDPLDIDEVGQHAGRPRQIDAVEIHGAARVGAGEDDVGADAADGELRKAGVL